MSREVVLRPEALADVAGAVAWCAARGPGKSEEFLRVLDECLESVARSPFRCPAVLDDARRAVLPHFPFSVVYTVTYEAVVVLACVLHRREPPRRWGSHRRFLRETPREAYGPAPLEGAGA